MSTDYRTESTVLMSDLFDGRLSKYDISEHYTEKTSATTRCLTENDNYIWVYGNPAGCATCLTRYGMNFPGHILNSIAQEFDTEIYSEYQPQFWGFSTQEEWDKWHLEQSKIDQEEFYKAVIQYLAGDGVKYDEGTIGRVKMEIAKELSNQNSDLLLPENKEMLLNEIDKFYSENHQVSVQLAADDLAPLNKWWSENMKRTGLLA